MGIDSMIPTVLGRFLFHAGICCMHHQLSRSSGPGGRVLVVPVTVQCQ
jgi:hypothetical protein